MKPVEFFVTNNRKFVGRKIFFFSLVGLSVSIKQLKHGLNEHVPRCVLTTYNLPRNQF